MDRVAFDDATHGARQVPVIEDGQLVLYHAVGIDDLAGRLSQIPLLPCHHFATAGPVDCHVVFGHADELSKRCTQHTLENVGLDGMQDWYGCPKGGRNRMVKPGWGFRIAS